MTRLVLRNGTVLSTTDGSAQPNTDILIEGDTISAVGRALEAPGAEEIAADGMIVMPGLVDAHLHTWQTGIRGIAGDWSLAEYFTTVHVGIAPKFTAEDIYIANLVGALNQINSGVTTLFDWCHNNPTTEHSLRAIDGLADAGIRAVFGHGTPKPDLDAAGVPRTERVHREDEIERIAERLADEAMVTQALCILGTDLASYEASEHDIRLARKHGLIASAHLGGRLAAGRKTPDGVLRLAEAGLLGPDFNSVHSNKLGDDELDAMVAAGVSFTMTPEVEVQMGHGVPVTGRLIARGVQPSIGIDIETGIASELLWAARFALQLQRGFDNWAVIETGQEIATLTLTTAQALGWATVEGARALGMEGEIGTIAPGKKADIAMVRAGDLNLFPSADAAQAVLYQSNSANLDTVIVGGRVMKRGGRLVRDDLDTLKEQLAESGRRILHDAGVRS